MAVPHRPTFSSIRMYPDAADAEYPSTSGAYMFQNQRQDVSPSYGYQNLDFSMTDAPFDPNPEFRVSRIESWNQTALDRWSTCDATTCVDVADLCGAATLTAQLNSDASRTNPVTRHGSKASYTLNMVPVYSPPSSISSPAFRELESPCSDPIDQPSDEDFPIEAAPRKRGRPRHTRHRTDPTNNSSSPHHARRSTCLPHKQVERKYREGLNMEFERLRRAIPTLPQNVDSNIIGVAKPSKGMILGAAIEYISRVEKERNDALDEVQRLGGNVRRTVRRP
jgi:hypothetical protein